MSIISERRKSKAETQPTESKTRPTRRRPIEPALLHGRLLRVKATELPRRRFLHLAARKLCCLNPERATMQLCIEWTTPYWAASRYYPRGLSSAPAIFANAHEPLLRATGSARRKLHRLSVWPALLAGPSVRNLSKFHHQ